MEEGKIIVPNDIYSQLLINDYKYNKIIELFKLYSELNYREDDLEMKGGFSDTFLGMIRLNENLIYESQLEKLIEKSNKKKEE